MEWLRRKLKRNGYTQIGAETSREPVVAAETSRELTQAAQPAEAAEVCTVEVSGLVGVVSVGSQDEAFKSFVPHSALGQRFVGLPKFFRDTVETQPLGLAGNVYRFAAGSRADFLTGFSLEVTLCRGTGPTRCPARHVIQSADISTNGFLLERITGWHIDEQDQGYKRMTGFDEDDPPGTVKTFHVPLPFQECGQKHKVCLLGYKNGVMDLSVAVQSAPGVSVRDIRAFATYEFIESNERLGAAMDACARRKFDARPRFRLTAGCTGDHATKTIVGETTEATSVSFVLDGDHGDMVSRITLVIDVPTGPMDDVIKNAKVTLGGQRLDELNGTWLELLPGCHAVSVDGGVSVDLPFWICRQESFLPLRALHNKVVVDVTLGVHARVTPYVTYVCLGLDPPELTPKHMMMEMTYVKRRPLSEQVSLVNLNNPTRFIAFAVKAKHGPRITHESQSPIDEIALRVSKWYLDSPRRASYHRLEVPWTCWGETLPAGSYLYYFDDHPAGCLNTSRTPDLLLELTIKPGFDKNDYDIEIMSRSYNIIRMMHGLASLAYAHYE